MRIVLGAKSADADAFEQVCDTGWTNVPTTLEQAMYRGQHGSGRVTWRISVYDERSLTGMENFVVSLKLKIFRDQDPVLFPPGTVSPQTTNVPGPRGMLRGAAQRSLGERGSSPFDRPIPDQPGMAAAPLDLLCWQITGRRTGQRTPEFPSAFSNASALLVE